MAAPLNWLSPEYQIFILVAQTGSISAAARKLGKDPGNLSRTLAKLEKLQGRPLFVRHQGGLRITEAGSDLFRALESGTEAFSHALSKKPVRTIRIGFSPPVGFGYFGEYFFPHLTSLGLTPEFTFASSLELFELLKKRELDLILSPRSPQFPGIISSALFTTRLALCSKNGRPARILVRSDQLFDLAKRLRNMQFDETLIINDYFVAAKMIAYSDEHMGIIPECILSNFPELKRINHKFDDEKISVITWKGSPGVELLRKVKASI